MSADALENNKWYKMWKDAPSPLSREVDPNYRKKFAKEILVLLGDVTNKKVLEFGCGNGILYENYGFDKAKYVGVDFSDSLLTQFKSSYPDVELHHSPAEEFKINEKFDLIFSCGMIQYLNLNKLDMHLSNAKKMLNKNGEIILASIPWKPARLSYLRNDQGIEKTSFKLILSYLKRTFNDSMGHWYDMLTIKKLARKHGFDYTMYGSLHYPYRMHVVLR